MPGLGCFARFGLILLRGCVRAGRRFSARVTLECIPNANVRLVAQSAEFYAGNVTSLSPNPPDYSEDDEADIRANLANWESEFSAVYGSFLRST